jgi:putative PEP-CTERM system TPR-repeat lipoprotein
MRREFPHRLIATALVACFTLFGCDGRSADDTLAAAKAHLEKSDLPAAIIELKNTLQSKPDLAEARFLLGKALLDSEEPVAASVELRKSADLNYPADQVVPLLAAAHQEAGEARKVVELDAASTLTAPDAVASLKTQLARAHAALGSPEKVETALTEALKANPKFASALVLRAQTLAAKRDFDGALRIAEGVLQNAPTHVDALMLTADLKLAMGDSGSATALYRKVLSAKPKHVAAHAGLLGQSLAKNDLDTARTQLAAMKKEIPKHPRTTYFDAWLNLQSGNTKAAGELAQQLLKVASDNPQVLHLAGVVALQRNELVLAEQHLGKLVQIAPALPQARRLLARVYLGVGETSKVIETLRPLLEGATDAEALGLAGTAYLQMGDPRRAEDAFSRAAKQKPDDRANRTGLALAKISRGDTAGLSELEAAAGADPGTVTDMALITTHLNRRDFNAALKAIDRLEAKQPGKAQPLHLRGQVLALRGDTAGARVNFEKALAAEPNFFPAVEGLAVLDLREKKPEQARVRIEAALKANPNDARAIAALGVLDERAGKPRQEVAATLAKAIAAKPADPNLRRQLIRYHLSNQDYKSALEAAHDAVGALPNDAEMLALQARAQLLSGDTNQAISSYHKLIAARPKAPEPLLALAEAQVVAKSNDGAVETVKKALLLAPESLKVMETAVKVDIWTGRHDQALAKARAVQSSAPKMPYGWIFEGEVEVARANWPAAVSAFRTALQKQGSTAIAQRLHLALRKVGDKSKAEAFAVEWLKKHPQDPKFLIYLSGLAIEERDFERAATQLEQALLSVPDNPAALNNLAWVQATLKKPGAVGNAERVNQLRPNQPVYMDTLAYALAAEGKLARAVEVQKKALELAPPSAHGLRLNMARLYMQAGDKAAARDELDTLAKLGDKFARQDEVRDLRSKL